MEYTNNYGNSNAALAKDIWTDEEAACYLTGNSTTLIKDGKIHSRIFFFKDQKVQDLYYVIQTWAKLYKYATPYWYINKAIAKNAPHLKLDSYLPVIKDQFLNLAENEKVIFIKNYRYIAQNLDLTITSSIHSKILSDNVPTDDAQPSSNNIPKHGLQPQKQKRTSKHSEFKHYVRFHARGETFDSWLKMMIDNKYVFEDESLYERKHNEENTDNSYDNVQRVGLIKNGKDSSGKDKYLVAYKIKLDSGKYSSMHNTSYRTIEGYFNEIRRKLGADDT